MTLPAAKPVPHGGTEDAPAEADGARGSFLYRSVRDLLADRIRARLLPEGVVLKEGPIATQLAVSRAPVRRALAILAEDGLIRAAEGQGYIVGDADPVTLTPRQLHAILAPGQDDIDRSATWERIFAEVSDTVTEALPFGTWRVLEAEMGDAHNVSRTVAREVLWRLMDRRLIEKNRSHWIAPQMTARDLHESFEMRALLEPHALGRVASRLDPGWLAALAERVAAALARFPACGAAEVDAIETAMFRTMFAGLGNARMLSSITRNQISLLVPRLFRRHFPLRDDRAALEDHAEILRHLRGGGVAAAQALLAAHLARIEPLTLARLRVLSVLPQPAGAPWLIPVH